MAMTYGQYLKVDDLLELQDSLSGEHDETLFIIIHQVYELWFKQILHEVDYLQKLLDSGETHKSQATLKRILTILKTLVGQVDILETMTPLSFASFRSLLQNSSGFQSFQFRKLEFRLGHKRITMLNHFQSEKHYYEELKKIYHEPSLFDSFIKHLNRKGYLVDADLLNRDLTQPFQESKALQTVLIDIYKNDPQLSQLCERFVDLDEGIQEWRYRHVKMVERTIGAKMGTGGSDGAEYLKRTLFQPLFPDLWSIRSQF